MMATISENSFVYCKLSYEVFIMKKLVSILLSVVMVVVLGFSTSVVAMAEDDVLIYGSQVTTRRVIKPSVTVNGNTTNDVSIDYDEADPNKITFTYEGTADLVGWEFYDADGNLLVEGVDYEVIYDGDQAIVTIINDEITEVIANAIVEEETTTPGETTTTPGETTTTPGETTTETTTKPNKGPESPDTGAVAGTGLAVAAAGVAILAALKRKHDAE